MKEKNFGTESLNLYSFQTGAKASYVTNAQEIKELIGLIKKARLLAIDTEFTRRTTYYPILSIIQIAVKTSEKTKELFIIDCLSDLDLSEIYAIISDPEITKIFHSSSQDLQIFYHQSNLVPQAIMDTQIMANFCGFDFGSGYSNLVNRLFGKKIDKDQQNSDWQARPLSSEQIKYAFLDVIFLHEIYESFLETLSEKNRFDWFIQEMASFISKSFSQSCENLSKRFSFRNRSSKQIFQIKNLISWREDWAKKTNVPRQHFLRDESIDRIVTQQNCDINLGKNFTQKILDEIRQILEQVEDFSKKEERFFMSKEQKDSYREAKKLISEISLKENLKEQFLVTSLELKKIICDQTSLQKQLSGWRYNLFGEKLRACLKITESSKPLFASSRDSFDTSDFGKFSADSSLSEENSTSSSAQNSSRSKAKNFKTGSKQLIIS